MWEAGSRPLCCQGPAPTVAWQCPLEQKPAAEAEGIPRMLSTVQWSVPLGEGALSSARPDLPGICHLWASLLLVQGLKLWGWGLETQGQGSPGPGYAGCWPEQIRPHHWWGQREKLGDKVWRQQKCFLQRLQNCLGVSLSTGNVNACGKAGQWRRLPAPSAPSACFLLLTSRVRLLRCCPPLFAPCFSFTNTACDLLQMCWLSEKQKLKNKFK